MDLVLFAVATVSGLSPVRLSLIGLALFFPWGLGLLVIGVVVGGRREDDGRAVRFLEGAAAELRSGSSLRHSLAASALAIGEPGLADHCLSSAFDDLGERVAAIFPGVGAELNVALAGAGRASAPSADLFDEMASLALAHDEISREVRVAAAPGRAAAGVFVGAPVAYLGWRWATGDLATLFATGGQRGVAVAGAVLFAAGLAGALLVLWRAR